LSNKSQLVAASFFLIFFTRIFGSSLPAASSYRTGIPQASRENESEVAHLTAQLKSSDEEIRRETVMRLSHLKGTGVVSALISALNDSSPRVRAAAAAGLPECGDSSVAAVLSARLSQEKDAFVRKTLAYALEKFQGSDRTAALIAALKDKDPEVRGAAAVALGHHADTDAVVPLINALSDKNPFVRAQAARALGVNGSAAAKAVPELVKLLERDEDGEPRRQAAIALGRIGDRSAISALQQASRDKDPYLVQSARDAIVAIEGKKR
jgi:HEAT repeat protein